MQAYAGGGGGGMIDEERRVKLALAASRVLSFRNSLSLATSNFAC